MVPIESLVGLREMTMTAIEQLARVIDWDPFLLVAALGGALHERGEVELESDRELLHQT